MVGSVRMTQVPIRNIAIKCGQRVLDVSLWKNEMVTELHKRDEVELTHLHTSILPNRKGKFHSANYTTVKFYPPSVYREFLRHLHADVFYQNLYIMSMNIHRGGGAIDSPVWAHSADEEVLPRRRFAYWTEETSQLLQGTLEPVLSVSKSTTTGQIHRSPSRRDVVEEDTDNVQQPTLVRDLYTAGYWVHNHRDFFRGEVTEPAFLQMNSKDKKKCSQNAPGGEFSEAQDYFLLIF